MENGIPGARAEFTPRLEDIKEMARQDVAVARERLRERAAGLGESVAKQPLKALGVALLAGVVLGWLIRRP